MTPTQERAELNDGQRTLLDSLLRAATGICEVVFESSKQVYVLAPTAAMDYKWGEVKRYFMEASVEMVGRQPKFQYLLILNIYFEFFPIDLNVLKTIKLKVENVTV